MEVDAGHLEQPNVAVYLVDADDGRAAAVRRWLADAGTPAATILADAGGLRGALREQARANGRGAALAVLSTDAVDDALLAECEALGPLAEEGRLGLIVLHHGPAPATAPLPEGVLDILPFTDAGAGRLALARRLQAERTLRLTRERTLETELAERRVMEARLRHIAGHDELTDLANRSSLEKALDLAILRARHLRSRHALLYLDLDRFKLFNDADGHASGDRLLCHVAQVLRQALDPEHMLARLGSDEFAVLLPEVTEEQAMAVAEELTRAVGAIPADGSETWYHLGASVGLAMVAPDRTVTASASQVLAQAEQACYVAKTRGGNTVHRFSHRDRALRELRDDMHWAPRLRQALADRRFFFHFQPIRSLAEGRIRHYEALLRLPEDLGGDPASAAFVPAAERLGLVQDIDLLVVEQAIDFLAGLSPQHCHISLGVNLSGHAFQSPALVPLIRRKLELTGVDPGRLTFEITETAAVTNFTETRRMVNDLRALGCRFALDDFGSGFSSYNYIKHFPVDRLKIDGSFIVDLRQDPTDRILVKSMVDIAHSLGKEVVAEFVEDAETLALLAEMGVDHVQGFHIGRPGPTLASEGGGTEKP